MGANPASNVYSKSHRRGEPGPVTSHPGGGHGVRLGLLTAGLLAALLAVAVVGPDPQQPELVTLGAGGPARPAALQSQPVSAVGARDFEQLLGHHVFLMARSMRSRALNRPESDHAFEDALVSNTEQLSTAIGSLYGEQHTAPFRQAWYSHVFLLNDYATGVATGDTALRDNAKSGLEQYRTQYGAFVESMTAGAIPSTTAAENLRAHLDHLTAHIDAYVAGDFATAFAGHREAYAHMFPTAAALVSGAAAPIPGELPTPPGDPSEQLRSRLSMLLGEHYELAVDLTRSGLTGAADFTAVAESLNANTRDLTAAFDSLFGVESATAFNQLWASHIDLVVRYTVAVAQGDTAGQQAAMAELAQHSRALGTTFSDLTAGAVPADGAVALLSVHDDHLVQQVNAYAATDYATAHQLSFDGYNHMYDTAEALAAGIETGLASNLPVGGVQTGGGGPWASAHDH